MSNPFKSITNFLAGYIGNWSYFIGTCVADGFNDRMSDIQEEEMNMPQEGEQDPFEVKAAGKPEGNHGAN